MAMITGVSVFKYVFSVEKSIALFSEWDGNFNDVDKGVFALKNTFWCRVTTFV